MLLSRFFVLYTGRFLGGLAQRHYTIAVVSLGALTAVTDPFCLRAALSFNLYIYIIVWGILL